MAKKSAKQAAGESSAANTYEVTLSTGKQFVLRPIPKHFFLLYSQTPSVLSDRAFLALKEKNAAVLESELVKTMTPKQQQELMLFVREAIKYACVKPRIALNPEGEDEISPFDITEEEFQELLKYATTGGQWEGLNSFR